MQPKTLLKRVILTTVLFGSVLFVTLLLSFIPKGVAQNDSILLIENTVAPLNQKQTTLGLPTRLKIPIIGVDSTIVAMGLTFDGAMDVPKSPTEVAWLNLGPRPGERGNTVIAGHKNWINNMPAVFDNLYKLNKNDKIFIENDKGTNIAFVVREIRIYDKDDIVPDVFISNDEKAHLNLITCAGTWNKSEETYSKRIVVFADKE